MLPQLGTGGWTPGRESSVRIRPGSRCRWKAWWRRSAGQRIGQDVAAQDAARPCAERPRRAHELARAQASTLARTSRAVVVQPNRATMTTMRTTLANSPWSGRPSLARSMAASTISSGSSGRLMIVSVRRIRTASTRAARIAGDQTDRGADRSRRAARRTGRPQAIPARPEQAGQHVPPEFVRAQRMSSAGRLEPRQEVDRRGVERRAMTRPAALPGPPAPGTRAVSGAAGQRLGRGSAPGRRARPGPGSPQAP